MGPLELFTLNPFVCSLLTLAGYQGSKPAQSPQGQSPASRPQALGILDKGYHSSQRSPHPSAGGRIRAAAPTLRLGPTDLRHILGPRHGTWRTLFRDRCSRTSLALTQGLLAALQELSMAPLRALHPVMEHGPHTASTMAQASSSFGNTPGHCTRMNSSPLTKPCLVPLTIALISSSASRALPLASACVSSNVHCALPLVVTLSILEVGPYPSSKIPKPMQPNCVWWLLATPPATQSMGVSFAPAQLPAACLAKTRAAFSVSRAKHASSCRMTFLTMLQLPSVTSYILLRPIFAGLIIAGDSRGL